MTIPVVNDVAALTTLREAEGPLRLKYDGGRLPILNSDYEIIGYVGLDLSKVLSAELLAEINEGKELT